MLTKRLVRIFTKNQSQVVRIILLVCSLFISTFLYAQRLLVTDAKTGNPIEGVIVFSETRSTQTNKQGLVDIRQFHPDEAIHFKHSSYLNYKANKQTLWSLNYKVELLIDPVKLDEIVVSANRRSQSKLEVPNQIVSINQEEIALANPQTTADLLNTKGGVFIQKSQMGGGSPMIRGFSANRLLLVIDGVRMNNAIYRNGNLHNIISLDAASIQHTEVIFGPGSVIYGSDALGGVLHFQTLSPKLSTNERYKQSRHAYVRYASANFEKTIHADFNLGNEKLATVASFTVTDFDDLMMGKHGPDSYLRPEYVENNQIVENPDWRKQVRTGYSQFNYLQKIRYRPNERWNLVYAFHWSTTSNIPRYDRLIQYSDEKLKYAKWYYGPQKWNLHSLKIQKKTQNLFFDQTSFLAGWQNFTESRHSRKLGHEELTSRTEKLNILSLNFDLDKKIDQNNSLYYGFEGNFNWLNSKGIVKNVNTTQTQETSSRYPDSSTTSSLAAYASYKLSLHQKVTLNLGGRFSINQLQGEFDRQFFDFPTDEFDNTHSSFTGNIGLVYHPTEYWQLNANASSGFRAPNIDDIAKVFDSSPGNVVVPNPNLNPEYARNVEIGILRSVKNLAKLELNFFYTYLNDAMVRRPFSLNGQDSVLYEGEMSRVEALVNSDYAHIYGGDLSMEWILSSKIRSRNSITATFGEDSEGMPVRHVAPVFGSSHLLYNDHNKTIDLYLNFNAKLSNSKLAPSEREKTDLYAQDSNGNPYSPGWITLNLNSSFQLTKKYSLNLGIESILDKRYRPYSSGIVAAGRNVILSFKAII